MKFILVDRIESIEPGRRIVTSKALSLAEEYLADHFPAFPVLPGVMMIESLVQAAAWLTRLHQNYAKSIIVLTTARNVKYANFVQPGNILRCEIEAMEIGDKVAKFKGSGFVGQNLSVSGRFELSCFNLVERDPKMDAADAAIISQLKDRFKLIGGPEALARAGATVA